MEKLFWGMVGACTAAFAILLALYLNKIGVINLSPKASTEESSTVMEEETSAVEVSLNDEERASQIDAVVASSQDQYADAMKVFEEASEEAERDSQGTDAPQDGTNNNTSSNTDNLGGI